MILNHKAIIKLYQDRIFRWSASYCISLITSDGVCGFQQVRSCGISHLGNDNLGRGLAVHCSPVGPRGFWWIAIGKVTVPRL